MRPRLAEYRFMSLLGCGGGNAYLSYPSVRSLPRVESSTFYGMNAA